MNKVSLPLLIGRKSGLMDNNIFTEKNRRISGCSDQFAYIYYLAFGGNWIGDLKRCSVGSGQPGVNFLFH